MDLYVFATSDVHGYVGPTDYLANSKSTNLGLAKAAGVIESVRQQHEHVIYIDNGDLIQGSALAQYLALYYPEKGPHALVDCLNRMGCDVGVIGNHEFNFGRAYMDKGLHDATFPILGANILKEATGEPAFQPYAIIERQGIRIGVLGLVTEFVPRWEKSAHIKGLRFANPIETAARWVPIVREKADIVIVSYHGGFERDPETGESISLQKGENVACALVDEVPGIDALITGHQHRQMCGIYKNVPFVMPGWRAEALGLIHLCLEKGAGGSYQVACHDACLLNSGHVEPNPDIMAAIGPLAQEVEEWLDQPIGRVEGDMEIRDPIFARSHMHPYVDFVNRLQMQVSGVDISCTAIFNAQSSGLPETVTVRNIVNNYVYANTLAVLDVSGEDLKKALERCAAFYKINEDGSLGISDAFAKPFIQYYNYDMYSGIDYTMDIRKPVGERIVQLLYHGEPVRADQRLKIVMNNYRAVGGGEYPMYGKEKVVQDIQVDMADLIVEYIIHNPVIKAQQSNNLQVLY